MDLREQRLYCLLAEKKAQDAFEKALAQAIDWSKVDERTLRGYRRGYVWPSEVIDRCPECF